MLAAAGLLARPPPSEAAFGEAANIFGKPTSTAGACGTPSSLGTI